MTYWDEGCDHRVTFPVPPMRRGWFYVYVAWGIDRTRPLYVGKANNPVERIGRHLKLTRWAAEVVEFDCYAFETEYDALIAESKAIVEMDPTYNVHRSNHAPRRAPYKGTPKNRLYVRRFDGLTLEDMEIIRRVQNRERAA